jgi:outer membrane biosynthesis protein TonB
MLQLLVSFTWETPRMSIDLIESGRRSPKALGGTFVSVALHAALISLAVYATANAGEVAVTVPADTVTMFYPPQRKVPAHPDKGSARPSHPAVPDFPREPVLQPPIDVPDKLPPIDASAGTLPPESLFPTRDVPGSGTGRAGSRTEPDSGEPMLAFQVDKPAMGRDGNAIPGYPSLLESSHVEGSVLVQFVVDTLGHADMQSFKVLEASNDLFAQSVESALPKWRFYPAEARGRKVKQIVQLPLKFVAPRR